MIHYEDYGVGWTEYWGSRSCDVQWVLEDDYGNTAESDEPYYVEVKVEKNGKTKWLEVFVGESGCLIDELRELCPEWFSKTIDADTGEEIELCQDYTLEEIEDDPSLVCERYSAPDPYNDYDEDY